MKLFLSWSGEVSQQIAEVFRTWLPLILQPVEPFITANDIDKGARWFGEISGQLEKCHFGIVCLTRENLDSQWLTFEAGAISKQLSSRVATILFGLKHADVKPPLAMFQGTLFNQEDVRKLLTAINSALPEEQRREEGQLDTLYPMLWPKLEEQVTVILRAADAAAGGGTVAASAPDYPAMVTELLALARSQAALLSSPEKLLAPVIDRLEKEAKLHALEREMERSRLDVVRLRREEEREREREKIAQLRSFIREKIAEGAQRSDLPELIGNEAALLNLRILKAQMADDESYIEVRTPYTISRVRL